VTNEEPANGLKILRKKTAVIDLQDELGVVTQSSVLQRLRLLLEKLESDSESPLPVEIIRRNIKYAVELIQDGPAGPEQRYILHNS
jgi:hypothetical protein